ncbi:MAG TPA: hypothetical protein VMX75_15905, partial [Spirochaetia bacterium]|nr:hypothetical protein [Spirochaetia bacterium]
MHSLQVHNREAGLQRLAIARSALDIKWWFNEWVWTFDPKRREENGTAYLPMVLWPKQEEFLDWLEERERTQTDGIAAKTRDVGFTWLCVGFAFHRWLFQSGFKAGFGSRVEDLVDQLGNPDSIFEKLRFLYSRLPGWMMPEGFIPKRHDHYMKLLNPQNGSIIAGEGGDNIGRGGRNTIYFIDEAAHLERPQRIEAALASNTNVRIDLSTPHGMGNPFHGKWTSGNISRFLMTWRDDPRKSHWKLVRISDGEVLDSGPGLSEALEEIPEGCIIRYPWHEDEKARINDPVIFAQEVDVDFSASIEGVLIPAKWVQAAVGLCRRVKLPVSAQAIAGFDIADGGECDTVLAIRRGPVVGPLLVRREEGTTDTANWGREQALKYGAKFLNYDAGGLGLGIAGTYKSQARVMNLGLLTAGINVDVTPSATTRWPDGRTS